MLKIISELFSLLTPQQRRYFWTLQLLVIIMAFIELISIASIAPFMSLVGNISLLNEKHNIYAKLYNFSGISNAGDFLFYAGLFVLVMLTISAFISIFTIWRLSVFANSVGIEISDRLYTYYMQKNWIFHTNTSSSYLTKQLSAEAMRVTNSILQPFMQLNAKAVLVLFISVSIMLYNPLVAILGIAIFGISYYIIYKLVRKSLDVNGATISISLAQRFKLMNEGFGGIKDILLLNRQSDFVTRFKESGKKYAKANSLNLSIAQLPRYIMELVAFSAMISLILLLIKLYDGSLGRVLPILGVYALAIFKLMPALQQIYSSIAQIRGNISAFNAIKMDLYNSRYINTNNTNSGLEEIFFKKNITLKNVLFKYPDKATAAIKNIDIKIDVNSSIGLVGASGCGKSTTVDLILGLLEPLSGKIFIDDTLLSEQNVKSWQSLIGYVSQNIFLSDGSIAENIAFGLSGTEININKLDSAIRLANLCEFIEELPDGINTHVGERGVQISGGQKQRIGIARALYNDTEVLVLDEATSALDGITEKNVMDAIYNLRGKKTIIMIAHRIKTIKNCDVIYLMDNGEIIDQGSYIELFNRNKKFKKMVEHA